MGMHLGCHRILAVWVPGDPCGPRAVLHLDALHALCLLLGDWFVSTGQFRWLALLALAWGAQVTIGHFQIQMWTAGLVLTTGGWRVLHRRLPGTRWLALASGLGWGAAIAWAQLGLTWELTRLTGFSGLRSSCPITTFLSLTEGQRWASVRAVDRG